MLQNLVSTWPWAARPLPLSSEKKTLTVLVFKTKILKLSVNMAMGGTATALVFKKYEA